MFVKRMNFIPLTIIPLTVRFMERYCEGPDTPRQHVRRPGAPMSGRSRYKFKLTDIPMLIPDVKNHEFPFAIYLSQSHGR